MPSFTERWKPSQEGRIFRAALTCPGHRLSSQPAWGHLVTAFCFCFGPWLWLPRHSIFNPTFSNTTQEKSEMGRVHPWLPPCRRPRQRWMMGRVSDWETKGPVTQHKLECSDGANTTMPLPVLGPRERSWPCSHPSGTQGQNIPQRFLFKERKRIKMIKKSMGAITSPLNCEPKNISILLSLAQDEPIQPGVLLKIGFNPSSWAPRRSPAYHCSFLQLPQCLISFTLNVAFPEVE